MTPTAYAAPLNALDEMSVTEAGEGLIRIRAAKTVRAADPYLEGHVPGAIIYPGVFILESLQQALIGALGETGGALPRITRIRSLRFLAPLAAGDRLHLEITLRRQTSTSAWLATAGCVRSDRIRAATLKVEFVRGPGAPMGEYSVLEHAAIRALLPQRWPMLLLDRVIALDVSRRSLIAVKAITATEPCFRNVPDGLTADRYAFPVSLLIESFGQAAAVLWGAAVGDAAESRPMAHQGELLMFAVARECVIEDAVYPGQLLRHEVRLENVLGTNAFASGACFADDRRVATMGSLMAVRRPVTDMSPA